MVDVNQKTSVDNAWTDFSQALKTGAIRGDDAVEVFVRFGLLQDSVGIEKLQLAWHIIFVPADDFFALVFQRARQR